MKLSIFFAILLLTISVNAQNYVGKWKLKEILIDQQMSDESTSKATLNISKDGKIGGNSSCNSFGGSYSVTKSNKIKFTNIFSTKMFCDGSIENDFFNALESSQSFTVKNGELLIMDKSKKTILKFVKQ